MKKIGEKNNIGYVRQVMGQLILSHRQPNME